LGDSSGDILLITDGVETCSIDPCVLTANWRASKVDVRVHVVGVGLSTQERPAVACIAENSGGVYFDAASSDEFAAALNAVGGVVADNPAERQSYEITLVGRGPDGRDYRVGGFLKRDGEANREIRSDRRIVVNSAGSYAVEVGPILEDGSLFQPAYHAFSVDPESEVTEVVVPVAPPAIVSAAFFEDGAPHPGDMVAVSENGVELFEFLPGPEGRRREILMRPGVYEFRSSPGEDDVLSLTAEIAASEKTELRFDLAATFRARVRFVLLNGESFERNSELWRDGKRLYKVHGRDGAVVRAGVYELRSDHALLPVRLESLELSAAQKDITVPVDAGFVEISYADQPENYLLTPDRAFLRPKNRADQVFARLQTSIPVAPGQYEVEAHDASGYFSAPVPVTVFSGQTANVLLEPLALGTLIVRYAEDGAYPASPDRAFAKSMGDQPLKKGFMRPGKPLKAPPGRYLITPKKGLGIEAQQVEVFPGDTTTVVLGLSDNQ
jgi:hypothetical protein